MRFHRDGVQEGQDTIQAFGGQRQQAVAVLSATRYDPEQARLVAAEVATVGSVGGETAPCLETYESLGESGHGALLADSAAAMIGAAVGTSHNLKLWAPSALVSTRNRSV